MPSIHMDLVCPNDSCPGGHGPQGGPWRRHTWTALGHSALGAYIYPDAALVCSECNTPGVPEGDVDPMLPDPEEDTDG
jgi:hypothetical protein